MYRMKKKHPKKININKPVRLNELTGRGLTRNEIKTLVDSDKISKISHGIYQSSDIDNDDENQFKVATKLISGPSAVGLISALVFYNLTDEIPKKVWLIVEIKKRSIRKEIQLFRCKNPHWNIGIINADGYKITNLERTIIDLINYQSRFGNTGIQALKKALHEKRTTLQKIVNMAEDLGVGSRLSPYIQVLL